MLGRGRRRGVCVCDLRKRRVGGVPGRRGVCVPAGVKGWEGRSRLLSCCSGCGFRAASTSFVAELPIQVHRDGPGCCVQPRGCKEAAAGAAGDGPIPGGGGARGEVSPDPRPRHPAASAPVVEPRCEGSCLTGPGLLLRDLCRLPPGRHSEPAGRLHQVRRVPEVCWHLQPF